MFVNCTPAPIVLGRFHILPGAKVPAVPLTDQEQTALTRLKNKGMLREEQAPAVLAAKQAAASRSAPTPSTALAQTSEKAQAAAEETVTESQQSSAPADENLQEGSEEEVSTDAGDEGVDKLSRRGRPAGK